MNFMRPRTTVTVDEFRQRIRSNVLVISDMSPRTGRPKKSVLGDLRTQMKKGLFLKVVKEVLMEMDRNGEVLAPSRGKDLYKSDILEAWAGDQFNAMRRVRHDITDPDPAKRSRRTLGELITIQFERGKTGRAEAICISYNSATPAELYIEADRIWKQGQKANARAERSARNVRSWAEFMADGERVDEAEARYYDVIRRGEKPTVDEDDDESEEA